MNMQTYCTYNEIKSQTQAWAQALDLACESSLPDVAGFRQVVFTGCGSTYYLSLAAAALYQQLTGRPARAVPGGELWLNPQVYLAADKALLVAISRSGTTTETVQAVERFRTEGHGDVVAISNYHEALSQLAAVDIVIERGQEQSVAQTRSFASLYVAAAALCARMAGRNDLLSAMQGLPVVGEKLLSKYEAYAQDVGRNLDFDRFYFLGSGTRYGLACEVSLKMKEMTLTHSEPFQFLEFRHGPMSMVNEHTLVAGLLSDANRPHEARVLSEMEALGATVASLGESQAQVAFESRVPESVRGVLYLPVLQLIAFYRALAKGLNPDRPHNLMAVVKLDL
jgi:glucosamine--fructose-6-phosphate aminotransferase (isomerizing)